MNDVMNKGFWIWYEDVIASSPAQVLFYKRINLSQVPEHCVIHVCADSCYNLYVNGTLVLSGPARGNAQDRFYDELDISAYLTVGDNLLFAVVVHYGGDFKNSQEFQSGPASVCTSMRGGFLVREKATAIGVATDTSWLCAKNEAYRFKPWAGYILFMEEVDYRNYPQESDFVPAVVVADSDSGTWAMAELWMLYPRTIPHMYREKNDIFSTYLFNDGKKQSVKLAGLTVPANSHAVIELDPTVYITANWILSVSGSFGSRITVAYSECMAEDDRVLDYERPVNDVYTLSDAAMVITPFRYRAFRRLIIRVETADVPLTFGDISLYSTGYPLPITTVVDSSDRYIKDIFAVSVRTLRCCMYETYMDCPYYEQMQYLQDTMQQLTYTYQVSGDDRLARKAMRDFASAQFPSGLLPCQAPARIRQIIPGFNAYFFLMLYDHYAYHRDAAFIRELLPTAKRVFYHFKRFINEDGLIADTGYWQCVDWVKEWYRGCPDVNGQNYLYSMMFAYAYFRMAELLRALSLHGEAEEYEQAAMSLRDAVNRIAYDETAGLYKDGPDPACFSQHGQLWAVLCGAAEGERAERIMTRAVTEPDFAEASFCMKFFLFRALEKSGCYALTAPLWADWTSQLDAGATTWAEDNLEMRSKCHAWSCTLAYELVACALGVTPHSLDSDDIRISPKATWLGDFSGSVMTRLGQVSVEWSHDGDGLRLSVKAPKNVKVRIVLPNGQEKQYNKTEIHERFARW